MDNTGSFGAAIGGMSPELQAAISRRPGTPSAGATSQVSQTAPTADPSQMMPPPPTGTASASTAGAPPAATPSMPVDPSEIKMLVGSLGNRLKAISKLQGA